MPHLDFALPQIRRVPITGTEAKALLVQGFIGEGPVFDDRIFRDECQLTGIVPDDPSVMVVASVDRRISIDAPGEFTDRGRGFDVAGGAAEMHFLNQMEGICHVFEDVTAVDEIPSYAVAFIIRVREPLVSDVDLRHLFRGHSRHVLPVYEVSGGRKTRLARPDFEDALSFVLCSKPFDDFRDWGPMMRISVGEGHYSAASAFP